MSSLVKQSVYLEPTSNVINLNSLKHNVQLFAYVVEYLNYQ